MKNKILRYIGVSVLVVALMSSIFSPSVAIGSTPIASDDGYEENDDFASAASISLGYYSGLEASDDDWYYFPVSMGDTISIDMYFDHSLGDLDITLYDSSNYVLTGSYGISDEEHLTWIATYTGDYYIKVYLATNGHLYDLNISTGTPTDDAYEDNDDFASAWELTEGFYDLSCLDGVDWFRIWVDDGRELYTEIYFEYSLGDLDLYLYDDSEYLLTSSTYTGDYDYIVWDTDYTGYYYILVDGLNADYELYLNINVPYIPTDFVWTEEPDPYFDYGVNDGDEFIYEIIFDADFTASETFYSLLDEYLITLADEDEYVSLSSDFSTESIINDLEDLAQQDFDLRIILNDIYNEMLTASWESGLKYLPFIDEAVDFPDGGYYIRNNDYFNVGLAIDDGDGWEEPQMILLQFLNDFEDIMSPYFEGEFLTDFQDEMDYLVDEITDPDNLPDWDDFEYFEQVMSSSEYYYQNGTHIPTEIVFPGEPDLEMPFPEFMGASGLPVFLPMEMNFEDYYNFLDDLLIAQREFCDDNPSECYWPDELADVFNLADMEGKVGIANIEVQNNAIGISFNLDEVDLELLGLIYFYEDLEEIGIYGFTGTLDYALEFDENWALLSMASYIHGSLTLDWDGITEAPIDFNEEVLELDLAFTICQQGFSPPTEDQIKEGEIGENRDTSPFNIPSYPIAVLGIIGLVSVLALVKKHKK